MESRGSAISLLLALLAFTLTEAYSVYRDSIPNGRQVPHPCKANYMWGGVGHTNPRGGGIRNVFGSHFHQNGATWNSTLCQMDSDGDGLTNGQELGDPQCIWTSGTIPSRTANITHPGVCDPWDSPLCKVYNAWVDCEFEDFKCDAIQEDADIENVTVRFPRTAVPNTETNYMCMTFDLPSDAVYHLVAWKPMIDNEQVMHHMRLLACDLGEDPVMLTPTPCGMSNMVSGCRSAVGGWTLGESGRCLTDEAGFRFGKGFYTRVILELHWNNPELRADYTDASGLTLYYTPNLRPNTAATLVIGQRVMEIPPLKTSWPITGSCPSNCSRRLFTQTLHVIGAMNHMHYLGRSQKAEIYREGRLVRQITNQMEFDYDTPVFYQFDTPIEIQPGDELRTTCVYDSRYKTSTTYFGEGTSDEMCFTFLTVYPAEAMPNAKMCVAFGDQSFCDRFMSGGGQQPGPGQQTTSPTTNNSGGGNSQQPGSGNATPGNLGNFVNGCNVTDAVYTEGATFRQLIGRLERACSLFGPCLDSCASLLAGLKSLACMQGQALERVKQEWVKTHEGLIVLAYLDSCPLALCPSCSF